MNITSNWSIERLFTSLFDKHKEKVVSNRNLDKFINLILTITFLLSAFLYMNLFQSSKYHSL